MTSLSLEDESNPTRRAILAAINRLLGHTPQRSTGRLNVTQLAVEAGVKRWVLTHQHTDLKDLFQRRAAQQEARGYLHVRDADEFDELKARHADLQAHCHFLEARLELYATALNLLAAENAALSDRNVGKVRVLPRRAHLP